MRNWIPWVGLVWGLFGCDRSDPFPNFDREERTVILEYLETNNLDARRTDENLYQYVIDSSDSADRSGDVFEIYYTVRNLRTGAVIGQRNSGTPLKLKRKAKSIFPRGVDVALKYVGTGERRGFIVPGGLGFDEVPLAGIPEDFILEVELEVISRTSVTEERSLEAQAIDTYIENNNLVDGPLEPIRGLGQGVQFKLLEEDTVPVDRQGRFVRISYTATTLGGRNVSALSDFDISLGQGEVIPGLDVGIRPMRYNDRALVIVPFARAYGAAVGVVPEQLTNELIDLQEIPDYASQVNAYETLVFDVRLLENPPQ